MISNNRLKVIRSLRSKKGREETGLFAAEGAKSVLELIRSDFTIKTLLCTEEFHKEHQDLWRGQKFEVWVVKPRELEGAGTLESNDSALAVAEMKPPPDFRPMQGLNLAVEGISDPGNMGALLRIADWYGALQVLASPGTVDFYNPKVLQASMGSFCRVTVHYAELGTVLKNCGVPVLAARKGGVSVHGFAFPRNCVILIGSESHGISPELAGLAKQAVWIPGYGKAESLNAAIAAAVLCDNYRRCSSGRLGG